MAKMNSKFKYMLDAAPSITLEAGDAAARTASGNTDAIELDKLNGYWNTQDELADQTFAVVFNVGAVDVSGDGTYSLGLEFGDDAAFTNSVVTHTLPITGTGQVVALVDFDTVRALLAGAKFMRVAATLGGTSPSINFTAFIGGAIIR